MNFRCAASLHLRECMHLCVCLAKKHAAITHTFAPVQANMFSSDAKCRWPAERRWLVPKLGSRMTSGQNESKQQGHGMSKTKSDMFFHGRMGKFGRTTTAGAAAG